MSAAKREAKSTEWVVLQEAESQDGDVLWRVLGTHVSRKRDEALKALAAGQTGRFRVVSSAAWSAFGRVLAQETLVTSKPLDD